MPPQSTLYSALNNAMPASGDSFSSQHVLYTEMAVYWEMANDLRIGTPALKSKSTKYLPMEPREQAESYATRLSKATFHNLSAKTISALVGLALRRSVSFGDDTPQVLHDIADDIDLQGSNLDQFTQDVLEEALWKGHTFIWADVDADATYITREQLRSSGIRPYLVHIKPEQVINWRHTTVKGREVLTMVNILESTEESIGVYGTQEVAQYRTYFLEDGVVRWELRNADGVTQDSGIMANIDEIPLYPVYSRKLDTFYSIPMLLDMYYLNLRHYQVSSDRAYHLHLCAVPFLKFKGRVDSTSTIVLSPNSAFDVTEDGDIGWVELSGATLEQQLKEMETLEYRMYSLGINTFGRQAVERRTATESSQDFYTANSDLHRVLRGLKNSLECAFDAAALLVGQTGYGSITLSVDYNFVSNVQEMQEIREWYKAALLPVEEVRAYAKRHQVTTDGFDPLSPTGTFFEEKPVDTQQPSLPQPTVQKSQD